MEHIVEEKLGELYGVADEMFIKIFEKLPLIVIVSSPLLIACACLVLALTEALTECRFKKWYYFSHVMWAVSLVLATLSALIQCVIEQKVLLCGILAVLIVIIAFFAGNEYRYFRKWQQECAKAESEENNRL